MDAGARLRLWHIIPADSRWFARAAVASVIVSKLKSLHAEYPRVGEEQEREMKDARKALQEENAGGWNAPGRKYSQRRPN
jgi:hypothetical protein